MSNKRTKLAARGVFAANVRRIRNEKGWSQDVFADLAGVHRTYVGAVERCEKNISLDNIEKFALALGVSVPDLLTEHTDG